ncbi:MAG: permease, partial [Gordonibacter sp.]|uniref:permease n=1 Tax=Gordonibacter sp. TaxID=1968902 RepID=UPI002FC62373
GEIPAFVREGALVESDEEESALTHRDRAVYAWEQVGQIVGKVWPYVLIGVGIGALIHNWIPTEVIQTVLGDNNPFSVILATLLGAPVYADIFGTLPIAEALVAKGVGVGTVVSFMMSVTVLSIPSLVMLKKVVSGKLLGIFIGVVIVGVIICGYALNAFGMFLV